MEGERECITFAHAFRERGGAVVIKRSRVFLRYKKRALYLQSVFREEEREIKEIIEEITIDKK